MALIESATTLLQAEGGGVSTKVENDSKQKSGDRVAS